jgi:hypothetical protein
MRKAGLAAIMFLQSCGTAPGDIRPLRPLELAVGPYDGKIDTVVEGSLMYEGGCLLLREDGTDARLLPIWPTGSLFDGTSVIFHQPAKTDQPILIAQQFVMEGRAESWPRLARQTYAPFEHQCGGEPFLVSNVHPAN